MNLEIGLALAGAFVTLVSAAGGALAFAFKLGSVAKESEARDAAIQKAHDDLEARWREGITGVRDRLYTAEGQIAALTVSRAETVVRLDTIVESLGQIRAMIEQLPAPKRRATKPR